VSIVLKGVARSVLTLLERYGCLHTNEAEGLRWLIEDTTITEAELKGLAPGAQGQGHRLRRHPNALGPLHS